MAGGGGTSLGVVLMSGGEQRISAGILFIPRYGDSALIVLLLDAFVTRIHGQESGAAHTSCSDDRTARA